MTDAKSKTVVPVTSLTRHPDVRAVVLMDRNGNISEKAGRADALLPADAKDPTVILPMSEDDDPEEALYVRSYGDLFLLVIFEDSADFEILKHDIDSALDVDDDG